jgi:hypothetical protein
MHTTIRNTRSQVKRIIFPGLTLCISLVFSAAVFGQANVSLQDGATQPVAVTATTGPALPVATIYRNIKIGTNADEVRSMLGKAEIADKDGFFYEMDSELVQIRLDKDKKVRLISVTYSNNFPRYVEIFGKEATEVNPDGSLYKLERYPDAGYWIAFSKTAGEQPSVTVTMQKL